LNARTLWMEGRFVNEIQIMERTVGAALRGRPSFESHAGAATEGRPYSASRV